MELQVSAKIPRAVARTPQHSERAAGEKPHWEIQRTWSRRIQAAAEGSKRQSFFVPLSSSSSMPGVEGQ